MTNEVFTTLNILCNNSSSNVKTRLKAIDRIIYGFKKNNVELTVPNIINALKAIGINMSNSSIYNKTVRGKPNPYRVLFDAWVSNINKSKLSKNIQDSPTVDFMSMTDTDFTSIGNEVVKFKVQMLYNELKSARQQINMLKQIQNLPIITETGSTLVFHNIDAPNKHSLIQDKNTLKQNIECNHIYIRTLEQFLNSSNKLEYDEDGFLIAKTTIRKGDILSDIDLYKAINAALHALSDKFSQ